MKTPLMPRSPPANDNEGPLGLVTVDFLPHYAPQALGSIPEQTAAFSAAPGRHRELGLLSGARTSVDI